MNGYGWLPNPSFSAKLVSPATARGADWAGTKSSAQDYVWLLLPTYNIHAGGVLLANHYANQLQELIADRQNLYMHGFTSFQLLPICFATPEINIMIIT